MSTHCYLFNQSLAVSFWQLLASSSNLVVAAIQDTALVSLLSSLELEVLTDLSCYFLWMKSNHNQIITVNQHTLVVLLQSIITLL